MYRAMGMAQCIARDADDYVEIALRLGTDAAHRQAVRAEILGRNAVLFENARVVRELERFFREATAPSPDS
jgi:predicted O-linked N-acetylglucosamine transferase (SPINDLY family)